MSLDARHYVPQKARPPKATAFKRGQRVRLNYGSRSAGEVMEVTPLGRYRLRYDSGPTMEVEGQFLELETPEVEPIIEPPKPQVVREYSAPKPKAVHEVRVRKAPLARRDPANRTSPEVYRQAIALLKAGEQQKRIAARLKLGKATVLRIAKRLAAGDETQPPDPRVISVPLRFCTHCGAQLHRKQFRTKLECRAQFMRRKTCGPDRAVAAAKAVAVGV